jgi:intein/homing endonuclease
MCAPRTYYGATQPDSECDENNPGYGCFKEGTKILTPNGEINIEDIKSGDSVYSYEKGKLVVTKVVTLFAHEDYKDPAVILKLANGIEIDVTLNHPFYDNDKNEYKELEEFDFNEEVVYYDAKLNEFKTTEIIGFERTDYFYLEYNLHLEKYHNFLANGVVVHNAAWDGTKPGIWT